MASKLLKNCEGTWTDKSTYDKNECLFHEKIAKVLPSKIPDDNSTMSNTSSSVETLPNTNPVPKKSKKVKDNKLATQESATVEVTKNSKNSKKNKKKEESQSKSIKNSESNDNVAIKNEDSDSTNVTVSSKKLKAKEAKEEKNKADKKHRNLEEDNSSPRESKEQLSSQGFEFSKSKGGSLAEEVARARQFIRQSLQCMDGIAALAGIPDHSSDNNVLARIVEVEKENAQLKNRIQDLEKNLNTLLETRFKELEQKLQKVEISSSAPNATQSSPADVKKEAPKKDDDDEDVDLFGSDSEGEDAEAAKIREERLAAYAAKKSKKPALIAKSSVILDVKPWDDETDMAAMEAEVRKIEADGLLWGAAKLVPVAFNIKKLQINCVVEDDKISIDWLCEKIQEIEDFVQSVDIAAFNKI